MIVEMLDGGQIELTEDTQVMICYATSTPTVGSTKKKILDLRGSRGSKNRIRITVGHFGPRSVFFLPA